MRTMKLAIVVLAAALVLGRAGTAWAAPASGVVPLGLTLKLHHEAQLRQLIAEQADPFSPLYGHFLTVAQFRAYFAPTPSEYAATAARLRQMGFTITRTWANRTLIDVSAPAGLVSQTFRVPLTTYSDRYGIHYAALGRKQIPAALASVGAVVGAEKPGFQTAFSQAVHNPQPKAATFIPVGPDGGFAPAALSVGLNFPSQHGVTGLGVKVADLIDGPPVPSDLTTFLSQFQITASVPGVTIVPVDGGGGFDTSQADIDAEWILAAAPGVTLYNYSLPFLGNGQIVDGYTKIVSDNIVDVVNTSFAACETLDPDIALAMLPILEQGASQGIAFENVAFGSANCDAIAGVRAPQTPSDSADGVSVGGDNMIEDSSGHVLAASGYRSSGGGVSVIVPVLAEQTGLHGVDQSGRNTPDIVVPAEVNGSGPSLYYSFPAFGVPGAWNGGFAFVNNAPLAGVLASYQQMVGHRLGAFDHTLYVLFKKLGYTKVFRDITVGCNGLWSGGVICARPGYDLTGGIGTANFYQLGKQLH